MEGNVLAHFLHTEAELQAVCSCLATGLMHPGDRRRMKERKPKPAGERDKIPLHVEGGVCSRGAEAEHLKDFFFF